MVPSSEKTGTGRMRRRKTKGPFKGVRMRKWGRWVSEIRVPHSRSRIWLGSYDTAEKAARAYDAALYCLRGTEGKFNFPDEKRPELPECSSNSYSKTEIKAVASRFASPDLSVPSSTSSFSSAASSPEGLMLDSKVANAWGAGELHFAVDLTEPDMFSPDSFLLEEPIMLAPDCIWDILDGN